MVSFGEEKKEEKIGLKDNGLHDALVLLLETYS
jgi:hypothetical protein